MLELRQVTSGYEDIEIVKGQMRALSPPLSVLMGWVKQRRLERSLV